MGRPKKQPVAGRFDPVVVGSQLPPGMVVRGIVAGVEASGGPGLSSSGDPVSEALAVKQGPDIPDDLTPGILRERIRLRIIERVVDHAAIIALQKGDLRAGENRCRMELRKLGLLEE